MDIKINVKILDIMTYTDKKTNQSKCRIGYILADKDSLVDTKRFKGYSECSIFIDNTTAFDKITTEDILQDCVFIGIQKPAYNNPLKSVFQLNQIITLNDTIDIL